ncbi:hypothetical protein VTH82DRAFT_4107 [Thermothelomyces myriococcoides]
MASPQSAQNEQHPKEEEGQMPEASQHHAVVEDDNDENQGALDGDQQPDGERNRDREEDEEEVEEQDEDDEEEAEPQPQQGKDTANSKGRRGGATA